MSDEAVNHPKHYASHPSGIECIEVVRHFGFNIGNVVKYCWRAGLKDSNDIEDLKKARWYLDDEINKREANQEMMKQEDKEYDARKFAVGN